MITEDDDRVWVAELEPPIKQRRIRIETTQVFEIWVDDDCDEGAEAIAKRLNADGDSYELIPPSGSIDADYSFRAPYEWESDSNTQHGPWRLCPETDCQRVQYPWYGAKAWCFEHNPERQKT